MAVACSKHQRHLLSSPLLLKHPFQKVPGMNYAPKLSAAVLADLKRALFRDFPSEVLSPDTCPSSRLIALTHPQVQKQDTHWVLWKYRLSQQRMDDIQMARLLFCIGYFGMNLPASKLGIRTWDSMESPACWNW